MFLAYVCIYWCESKYDMCFFPSVARPNTSTIHTWERGAEPSERCGKKASLASTEREYGRTRERYLSEKKNTYAIHSSFFLLLLVWHRCLSCVHVLYYFFFLFSSSLFWMCPCVCTCLVLRMCAFLCDALFLF